MRVPLIGFLVVFASLGLLRPGMAMDAGSGATPTSAAGRVGSLSPDEQRRALRARQRAASKTKAADVLPHEASAPPAVPETKPSRRADSPTSVESSRRQARATPIADHRRLARRRRDDLYRQDTTPGQYPRVGDVVPRDVRLYSVPTADTRNDPPFPRSPPGYPPFPRP